MNGLDLSNFPIDNLIYKDIEDNNTQIKSNVYYP